MVECKEFKLRYNSETTLYGHNTHCFFFISKTDIELQGTQGIQRRLRSAHEEIAVGVATAGKAKFRPTRFEFVQSEQYAVQCLDSHSESSVRTAAESTSSFVLADSTTTSVGPTDTSCPIPWYFFFII